MRGNGASIFSSLVTSRPIDLQIAAPLLQAALHQKADEVFRQVHEVVEFGVGHLGLDHPELGEVAARLGFFRAERWPEGIHLAQRHGRRLDVELAGLGEICLLVKVIDRKQRARALAGGRSKDGRIGQDEAALVKEVPRRLDDLRPHPQDRRLPLRAHPQVTVLHQEFDAVLFRRNRVGIASETRCTTCTCRRHQAHIRRERVCRRGLCLRRSRSTPGSGP